jgi:2-polyprenyl-6-methoxyphenol hydroxylase-like FAD-dependent oxidoreductase
MSYLLTLLQVGGSLAGLMNGNMLRHQGYTVTILEQDPATSQRRSQAAGIAPGPDFLKFLEKYDRTSRPFSDGKGAMYICAKDGSTARKLPFTFNYSSWGLLNSILRANFDCHVSKACPIPPEAIAGPGESIYLSGKRVTGVQFTGEKVLTQFTDVSSQSHDEIVSDLVIAADGSSSTIRNIIWPKVRPRYSGYVTWRGTVPESQVSTATSDYFDGCAKFFKHLPKGYMLV